MSGVSLFSQEFFWRAGFRSFFDNIEFAGSEVKASQTMAGVIVVPEAGFTWDSVHTIAAGLNLIHEFGSTDGIGKAFPSAWYRYSRKPYTFVMGAFPREIALEKYPKMFFQDSLSYYRPVVNGIFFRAGDEGRYANIWLDWTGRQAENVREAFFVGLSGRYNIGIFYMSHFSYMFHYASRKDPLWHEPLHDNLLMLTSAGADLSGRTIFDKLEVSAGLLTGLERERSGSADWITRHGFFAEARAEYRFAGIYNSFYAGEGLMHYYNIYENNLYWGDPVYRARMYDRLDLYVNFFRRKDVDLELTWSLHFLEGSLYQEQLLKLKIDISSMGIAAGRR